MTNAFDFFSITIWEVWEKYQLGDNKHIAVEAGVTPQTVRNFKRRKYYPLKVIFYMVGTILWELELNSFYMANKAGVTEREVKADRDEILTLLMTCNSKGGIK